MSAKRRRRRTRLQTIAVATIGILTILAVLMRRLFPHLAQPATRRVPSSAHSPDAHAGRREVLDRDLTAAWDAAKQRLADAVSALEGIRLNLLRLTAGAGSVDSLMADLAAARHAALESGTA